MAEPARAHALEPLRVATIRGSYWVRFQLVLELELPETEPRALALRATADSTMVAEPARVSAEDDRTVVRFNVMQGPGLDPLAAGRWVLIAGCEPLVFEQGTSSCSLPEASFVTPRGEYRVTPDVDPAGALCLTVEIDSATSTAGHRARRRRARRRARRGTADRRRGRALRDGLRSRLPAPLVRVARRIRRRIRRPVNPRRMFRRLFRLVRATTRRNGRRVVFVSMVPPRLRGNLRSVHDRMVERGLDRTYELRSLFTRGDERRTFRESARLAWQLARADVILLAGGRHRAVYEVDFGAGTRIIQLWHASGAFKTVGYSRIGKPDGPDPWSRVHKNYTAAIVSSEHDVPFYAEAFGIPESRVAPIGIPRMDRFFDESMRARGLAAARAEFPMTEGRRTILIAPTYRGHGRSDGNYDFEQYDYAALHRLLVELDAIALVRRHSFIRTPPGIPDELGDRIVDASQITIDVNDLLLAVDVLVTDYSSIMFDFATLRRPMIFFAYDLDEYVADRDFYVPFDEFAPGPIVRTFDELLDALRCSEDWRPRAEAFADEHFAHLDAHATDRVIDQLILPA